MYVRIEFQSGQQISKEELNTLESTLEDKIEFITLVENEEGKLESFSSWSQTLDPNDECFKDEKNRKKLVKKSDFVQLDTRKEYFADIELFITKHPTIKFAMRGLPKTIDRDYSTILTSIMNIQDKFENALKKFDKTIEFNEKVDVHVGNLGLMNVNEIALMEDGCSDDLQNNLNKGWRLLAVCVQPARRPDYILGRYNPDCDSTKAVRL